MDTTEQTTAQRTAALILWDMKTDPTFVYTYSPIVGYCPTNDGRMGAAFDDGDYLVIPEGLG
jgi:hypothetical protein